MAEKEILTRQGEKGNTTPTTSPRELQEEMMEEILHAGGEDSIKVAECLGMKENKRREHHAAKSMP